MNNIILSLKINSDFLIYNIYYSIKESVKKKGQGLLKMQEKDNNKNRFTGELEIRFVRHIIKLTVYSGMQIRCRIKTTKNYI